MIKMGRVSRMTVRGTRVEVWVSVKGVPMRIVVFAALSSLVACTSTYHPEYHPVTTTTVTQQYSSNGVGHAPVVVGGAPTAGGVVIEQPPAANPEEFFSTSYR
jgi:hypothetical protein